MARARRSLFLTPIDQERLAALVGRSGLDASSSVILIAALSHYKAQLPLAADVVGELNTQLVQEHAVAGDGIKTTSFSLHETEAADIDELVKVSTLTRRFSMNALIRLALLVFSFATDEVVRATCLALPARPRPGPRPASINEVL